MGVFDEVKADGMKSIAILGVLFGFLALFWVFSQAGLIGLLILVAILGGGYFLWKQYRGR